jgi:hypothetical protein
MLKKLVPFVLWLLVIAVALPLFQPKEEEGHWPFTWLEEGAKLESLPDHSSNLFSLKFLKKFKGAAASNRDLPTGKNLCGPGAETSMKGAYTENRPLFLLHHAFLFYDFT